MSSLTSQFCRRLNRVLNEESIIHSLKCLQILNWFECDNNGFRLVDSNEAEVNRRAVGAAFVVRDWRSDDGDVALEMGELVSVLERVECHDQLFLKAKKGSHVRPTIKLIQITLLFSARWRYCLQNAFKRSKDRNAFDICFDDIATTDDDIRRVCRLCRRLRSLEDIFFRNFSKNWFKKKNKLKKNVFLRLQDSYNSMSSVGICRNSCSRAPQIFRTW